jgi:hypothetical protein
MEALQELLDVIYRNNSVFDRASAARVLILFEQKEFMIGDTCIRFYNFSICRSYFGKAIIDLRFRDNDPYFRFYEALLRNNPNLDSIAAIDWNALRFEEYDVVICAVFDERVLASQLSDKYRSLLGGGHMKTAIFSMSPIFIYKVHQGGHIFPLCDELLTYSQLQPGDKRNEIYISGEEKKKANQWLKTMGLREGEALYVFLDSSSVRDKLLKIEVYFKTLSSLLRGKNVRVLIFDEKDIGKELFYKEWLGNELASKLIFSKRQDFRMDLTLLAADQVELVFGPCTGLLHCASAIFNHFLKNDIRDKAPSLIAYTGKYTQNDHAQYWWGNSPLVSCVLLKNISGKPSLCVLDELPDDEKINTRNIAGCKEYTPDLLIPFIEKSLKKRG